MGKRDKSQNVIRGGSDLERKGANRVDLVAVSYGPRERRDKLGVVAAPPPPPPPSPLPLPLSVCLWEERDKQVCWVAQRGRGVDKKKKA